MNQEEATNEIIKICKKVGVKSDAFVEEFEARVKNGTDVDFALDCIKCDIAFEISLVK